MQTKNNYKQEKITAIMYKYLLLQLINDKKIKESKVFCIDLLKKFLESEPIKKLNQHDDVSFNDYLNFLRKDFPNVIDLFKKPFLTDDSTEHLLYQFLIIQEKQRIPLVANDVLTFKLKKITYFNEPVSAIAILPDGNMITATCAFNQYGIIAGNIVLRDPTGKHIKTLANEPTSAIAILPDSNMITTTCAFNQYGIIAGDIVLRDPTGKRIKTLANEPASAIAILPDGNMITATCAFNQYGIIGGGIVLRDPTGKRIKTLANQPTSAITILPDSNIITTTCAFNQYGVIAGNIVLRDPTGNCIKTLANEPASAIAILPDGNMITTTCGFNQHGIIARGIVLRDPTGKLIKTLANEPASAIAILPDGNMITAICAFNQYGIIGTGIGIKKPELIVVKNIQKQYEFINLLDGISELVYEQSQLACIQFHKGVLKRTSDISILCYLPRDILNAIYSYIFTGIKNYEILNKDCFPSPTEKDYKEIPIIQVLDKKVYNLMLFKQTKLKNDVKNILNDILEKKVFKSGWFEQANSLNAINVKNDRQTKHEKRKGKKKCSIM